jgi:hypothetical protein
MGGQGSSQQQPGGSGAGGSGFRGRLTDEERRIEIERQAAEMGASIPNRAQALAGQEAEMSAPWSFDQSSRATSLWISTRRGKASSRARV